MSPQQERILIAAAEMFFRHGIRTITMDEIAGRLGMSKKTIYRFYPEKNRLIHSFTACQLTGQLHELEEIRIRSENAISELMNLMKYLAGFFNKINPAVFYDLQKHYPDCWKSFKDFKEKHMIGFVEDNLRNGIRQELYRPELNVKMIARLRIEEVELGMNPDAFPPRDFNVSEVQLALLDHYLHGIVTMKGYKLINKYKHS